MIRRLAVAVATLSVTFAVMGTASAQYPNKSVKIIMPAAPGGGTDVHGRLMAQRLSEKLGQQFVIENVSAAGGNVAAAQLAKADPDGYTLLMIAPATVINHTLYAKPGFDAVKDFVQIAAWAHSPLMFIANPGLDVTDLKSLAAKAKAEPGKLSFGSGPGFINHMVMELYKIEAGVNIQFIPYRGQAPALTDVISGVIPLTVDSLASAGQQVVAGKVKALAVTGAQRAPNFPNVPTVAESGFPKITSNTWYGLLGPAKMPKEIVDKLSAEIGAIQREPEMVKRIQQIGADPFIANSAEFTKYYMGEVDKWSAVIKAAGLKIE